MTSEEAQIHALIIQAQAISAEVLAMQAHDRVAAKPYTEEEYVRVSNALYAISEDIQRISRDGWLA